MLNILKSGERGTTLIDWLDSKHSFSFGSYYDPKRLSFGLLRVINDDKIAPNEGFDFHPHQNMEIITYIIKGKLKHQDSMNNQAIIIQDQIQLISAGTGMLHSETNPSPNEQVHLLQIWIKPKILNIKPHYQQLDLINDQELKLIISPDGEDNSLKINQDCYLYILNLKNSFKLNIKEKRKIWLQIISGNGEVNNQQFAEGDGISIKEENILIFSSKNAKILIIDLP